jgi:hypothetical protein
VVVRRPVDSTGGVARRVSVVVALRGEASSSPSEDRISRTATVTASRNAAGAASRATSGLIPYQPAARQTSRASRAASAPAAARQSTSEPRYA